MLKRINPVLEPVQIVWFKRDLRVADHQPLLQASRRGPVLPLLVVRIGSAVEVLERARH